MGAPSLVRQVNLALDAIFRPGWKRHELRKRGVAERWIVSRKTRRAYGNYCTAFALWAAERYGIRFLRELEPHMGEAYLRELEAEGKSPHTLQPVRSALRKLRWGIFAYFGHWVETVPEKLKLPKRGLEERKRAGAYSPEEARTIMAAVKGPAGHVVRMQYCLGLRVSEVVKLRPEDVDFEAGVVWVTGKGGRLRGVPIPPGLVPWLCDLVVATPPGMRLFPVSARRVQQVVREACQAAGIKVHGTHGFRHSYAVDLYGELQEVGFSDREAREVITGRLGHNRVGVTTAYVPRLPRC